MAMLPCVFDEKDKRVFRMLMRKPDVDFWLS